MTAGRNNISLSQTSPQLSHREQLEAWANEHRSLLEILLDAYAIVDEENRVVDFNVAFTELCGETYRKIHKIGEFCELIKTEVCPHQCPARQIISSEKPIRLDELSGSSKAYPTLNMIVAGVPITGTDGKTIGSLVTIRNVSAETELQKKYGERTQESITDGLTQLFNKKYAETALLRVIKHAFRDQVPFSIGMVDIDHFKKVNDTYGHQAGDYVLSMVAQILKGECRDSDIVGRFGGEEFIVILAKADVPGATIFAERFRKRIESTAVLFDGKRIPVTVSIGTSTFIELWQPGSNAERSMKDIVNKADTALYFAKANGRNQVCQFEMISTNEDSGKAPVPNPGDKKE